MYVQHIIDSLVLVALLLAGCVAPWFFGAWEMWWFWPFAGVLAFSAIPAGILLLRRSEPFPREARVALGLCGLYLVYFILRWWQGDVVFLDAERKFLLVLTGIWVAVLTASFLGDRAVRYLYGGLFSSLSAMALYGIINHVIGGSRLVLWAPRYEQYAGRATGPYFCPDHFAGAMELLVCLGLGLLLDRASNVWKRVAGGGACLLGVIGAVMSLSRGSGMTLVVLGVCVLVWGFYQWPVPVRYSWRLVCVAVAVLFLFGAFGMARSYRERFMTYGGLHHVSGEAEEPVMQQVWHKLLRTSRGRMYTGAVRAWQTAPWLGIGPGMHRHLWPAFADSGDGDRESGTWPTLVNEDFHSYEVHSDWLELLEEMGLVGFVLFAVACGWIVFLLHRRSLAIARDWQRNELRYVEEGTQPEGYAALLAGIFSIGAMGFHSLGDFNLQMPGTVWMLGILVGLGLREGWRREASTIGASLSS